MNLYVGNLPYALSENDLKNLFIPFGEVKSVKIIKDNFSKQSKGFGFVEMANSSEGQAAIKELNERAVQDRRIIVNVARSPKARTGPGGYGSGGYGGGGARTGNSGRTHGGRGPGHGGYGGGRGNR
jgi:RNA recognition motif-containing protein